MDQARNGQGNCIGVVEMMDVKTKEFGKVIKMRLIELEMTQTQLAEILGISRQELSRMLKGRRPGYKYREKMLKVLNLDKNDVA